MSATALVSYPLSIHQERESHEGITGAFPLLPNDEDEPPNLFNVHLPLSPDPKRRRVIDDVTGEIDYVPQPWRDEDGKDRINRCCKNSCPVCVVINAQRIAGAIMLAEPSWWFCLTLVGDSSSEIHKRVGLFIHYARKEIPSLQACWAAEENPDHTGCHVHGYFHVAVTSEGSGMKPSTTQ